MNGDIKEMRRSVKCIFIKLYYWWIGRLNAHITNWISFEMCTQSLHRTSTSTYQTCTWIIMCTNSGEIFRLNWKRVVRKYFSTVLCLPNYIISYLSISNSLFTFTNINNNSIQTESGWKMKKILSKSQKLIPIARVWVIFIVMHDMMTCYSIEYYLVRIWLFFSYYKSIIYTYIQLFSFLVYLWFFEFASFITWILREAHVSHHFDQIRMSCCTSTTVL